MPALLLKKGRESRARSGHPWVYAGEVERERGSFSDGDIVDVRDHSGRFVGRGYVNRRSEIVARILTWSREAVDEAFFRKRIDQAVAYRAKVVRNTDAYRVVFSEGDLLPGLIVDRYGPYLVVQFLTLGMEQRKDTIIQCLNQALEPEGIYERSDASVRQHEGLSATCGLLKGEFDTQVSVREAGLEFVADVAHGQKTGLFLDQRENRQAIGELVHGARVLDCFCYSGGFGIHAAARGASDVVGVDLSEEAVRAANHHAHLNGVSDRCRFEVDNAFDRLKAYDEAHAQFDMVVLDPPSFTRSSSTVGRALRGYKEINLRALRMLSPGGYLITSSCSYHVSENTFRNVVMEAARDAGRPLRLVESRTQARDHPILPQARETQYLKCLVLQTV